MSGIAVGCIYAMIAVGFVLIFKATDILNFAHGEIMMMGAYICYMLMVHLHFSFLPAIAVTLIFFLLMGVLTERLVFRPMIGEPVFATVMVTLGLSIFLRSMTGIIFGHTNRVFPSIFPEQPLAFGKVALSHQHLWVIIVAGLMISSLFAFFKFTRTGLSLRSAANDQLAAMLMGISVKKVFAIVWGIAFLVAALAGIFLGNILVINNRLSLVAIKAFPAVILGGLQSIPGAIIGGIIIGVIENLAGGYLDQYFGGGIKNLSGFIVLFIILMVRPYGLFGKEEIERV
ncbi:MAG: branched-chain amino acid ABC transporter permease [Pseudomonadota bacterium]